jgi:predicted RNA-binding protein with RPS1 domain
METGFLVISDVGGYVHNLEESMHVGDSNDVQTTT